ncbi:MAG: permease, partial [Oscillospiraceae bacterium]|nr:permease [Oscillospiraceae bacterium]
MTEIIHREAVYLWYYFDLQLRQILPYFLAGIVIGSVISVFVKDRIHDLFRSLGNKKLGVLGVIPASILGIASPLCMYGTIPIAASFSKSGIKDDWLAAFMMSSILLNPQLIIYSTALGGTALAIRVGSCFICGIAAGILVRIFYKDKLFFNFSGFDEPKSRDT